MASANAIPEEDTWFGLSLSEKLDCAAKDIMLNGLCRPKIVYFWHLALLLVNYGTFGLVMLAVGPSADPNPVMHAFVKLIVWQHFAESLGCRQGPMYGHVAPPCNLWYPGLEMSDNGNSLQTY